MDWSFLYFLGQPWFVIPWYAVGALGAAFLIHDLHRKNTVLKPAMKWAWPIIVFFFSVIGLFLYFTTARAPGIGRIEDPDEKQEAHDEYERAMWRRANGAVIHCVAGDGFGIMTGMVIARASGMSFWQEFWFEYLVGFAIGWFIFQRKSMTMMTDSIPKQLAMAFRGEFFSMLTVMGGMGAVMTYITPLVATSQPKPLTYAFWGFGMFGLVAGFILTWPMNAMMVKLGWKHGMGGMEGAEQKQVEGTPARAGLVATMSVLGAAALVLVAWLTELRQDRRPDGHGTEPFPAQLASPAHALGQGIRTSLHEALGALGRGDRTSAAVAMDDAHRAAEVGGHSAPGALHAVLDEVKSARLSYQQGDEARTARHLERALRVIRPTASIRPAVLELRRFRGATVISPEGAEIGEVVGVAPDSLRLALGGWRAAWGFLDFGGGRELSVAANSLGFGPPRSVGMTLVMLPRAAGTAD